MKRIKINFLAIIALAAIILSGCGGADKMKDLPEGTSFNLNPNPLEVHANKVEGTIEGTFPAKYFNKKAMLEITPVLVYEGGQLPLEVKMLQGQDVTENHQAISFDAGGSFSHEIEFEYTDEMLTSELELRMVIIFNEDSILFDEPQKVGVGVIATSQLYEVDPKPAFIADNFVRITPQTKEAQVNFVIQRSNIRNSELTKDDVAALEEFIAEAGKDDNLELKGISLSSYASPDGPMDLNEKLSKERAQNTQNWLNRIFRSVELDAEELLSAETTAEDWEGFKELVEASEIEDKELILRVLSMYSDPEVREKEIKNLSKVYLVLAEKILPELRRSKMIANVDLVGYSDEQLVDFVEADSLDHLNVEEILYAATLIEDADTKITVYQKAAEVHGDVRGYNNAGFVAYNNGDIDAAKAAFEAAADVDANNHAVKNNMGCIALIEGNYEEAQNLFVEATNAGAMVQYNLGIIALATGKYPASVEYLAGTDTYNQGLAMLLSNRNDAAKNTFDKVDSAKSFYGLAIVGARTQNETEVLNNLRTAVGKDAALKERAKKDLEFRNYFQNDAFIAVVQ